jgi:phosphotransferase system HPr-like phosphotransfer protein
MQKVVVSLDSVEKATSFVNDISNFDYDCDLIAGRYVIDPKSIMGVLSLDLSRPLELHIHDMEADSTEYLAPLHPYLVQSAAN